MTTVCFGELLIRLSAPGRQLLAQSHSLDLHVGGAEANVAIGLASLGHSASMVSCVPDDALGQMALVSVRGAGVNCTHVSRGSGRMGLYFLTAGAGARASDILYDRQHSAFNQMAAHDIDWDRALVGATRLHLSGITPALGANCAEAALIAARKAVSLGIPISFDGNYRARLWEAWDSDPRAILGELVSMADILFGNHRDIALLLAAPFSGDGPDRRREAAQAAFAAFPRLQIIASTARHVENVDHHRVAARIDARDHAVQTAEVHISGIVDRIGAGDAYAAGVLHGLICDPVDIEVAARAGLALTVLKHSLPGDASLFGQADIDAFWSGERDVRR